MVKNMGDLELEATFTSGLFGDHLRTGKNRKIYKKTLSKNFKPRTTKPSRFVGN